MGYIPKTICISQNRFMLLSKSNGPTYLHDVCSFNHPKTRTEMQAELCIIKEVDKKNSTKLVPHVYFVNMFTEAKGK